MLKWLRWVLLGITLAVVAAGYALWQVQQSFAKPLAIEQTTEFEVAAGQSGYQVLNTLGRNGWYKADGLLADYSSQILLKLHPELARIKTGWYELTPGQSLLDVMRLLVDGKQKQFSVTLVEGGNLREWLAQLRETVGITAEVESPQALAKALGIEQDNPEGWFFPSTYQFTKGYSDLRLFKRAHKTLQAHLERVWSERDPELPLKSPYELLILASIIEKETALDSERDWVAAVFVNRLNKGMRLQTDPTVIYGLGERYQGDITRAHLHEKTAYNTYRIDGLPPTPISSVSLASLEAAAHPADVDYLYFVANNKGGHTFSKNLADHNKAVREYLRTRK
ncbi:endolytic transglycosylase MltG [Paraferrimonas sedimenticola]|uniref:Endolytic murein transglycosylase n=1 Tax=Paraferrimonas sedimenticola TaxID=375674 RepID=A0AA37RZI9_9GAMM|nr:endolytic transglycosylase MltG [Paraferrimonas sedimenticola]GLP98086.1 cell division protein YceG [Paraferrimonas sedimenticola]